PVLPIGARRGHGRAAPTGTSDPAEVSSILFAPAKSTMPHRGKRLIHGANRTRPGDHPKTKFYNVTEARYCHETVHDLVHTTDLYSKHVNIASRAVTHILN